MTIDHARIVVIVEGRRVAFDDLARRMDAYLRRTLEQAVAGSVTYQDFADIYAQAHARQFGRSVFDEPPAGASNNISI